MEEADLLADHIAIMAHGRIAAEGTPLDLKSRYGVGYTLTLARQRADDGSGYVIVSLRFLAATFMRTRTACDLVHWHCAVEYFHRWSQLVVFMQACQ